MLTNKKAQVLTYDFFIALSIFLVVLIIAMSNWYYSMLQIEEILKRNQAINILFLASQAWFKEGYPKYWGTEDVLELGMSNDNRINRTKMDMLAQLGYSRTASLLNLGTYNLQYTIYDSRNQTIFHFPSTTNLTAKNVYKIERVGILDEQPVVISTIIWG